MTDTAADPVVSTAPEDDARRYRLAKTVGVLAVTASAVAQEYGSGINFVSVQSLSVYPGVHGYVPLAMLLTGLALFPKAYLYAVFSAEMPRAGSAHVWIARSLGLPAGFLITFLYWATGPAGMAILGYAFGTFLGQAMMPIDTALGMALLSPFGHLASGLAAIWITFGINAAGIRYYGLFVIIMLFVIIGVAATITALGFATSPDTFITAARQVARTPLLPPANLGRASLLDFASVCGMFVWVYAGLAAGPALGGEVANAKEKVPLGIYWGWAAALILFTALTAALFHAAPWWAVIELIKSGHGSVATAPGLVGLIAFPWLTVTLNLAVALIVGKTFAPALMVASRFCFAHAQDHLLPPIFAETSHRKVPLAALLLIAVLGSLFLLQSVYFGWAIGVAVRALAVLGVWLGLAIGALNLRRHKPARDTEWATAITRRRLVVPAASVSIILGVPLALSVAILPQTPFVLQPLFQGVLVLGIGVLILIWASGHAKRRGTSFREIAARVPLE